MMKKLIATCGGVGLLPGMPGTYASLVAAGIFYWLWMELGENVRFVIAPLTLVVALLALKIWPWSRELFKAEDPRQFVLDEVVGQWAALLFIPLAVGEHVLCYVAVAFFLFRGFDVAKPWPVSAIDRLPGKWGTLLDDVAAGVYAIAGFYVLFYIGKHLVG